MTRTTGTTAHRTAPKIAALLGCAAVALAGCSTASAAGKAAAPATSRPTVAVAHVTKFPADAHVITFTEDLGLKAGKKKPPKPVTVTGVAKARKIVALIDAQPRLPKRPISCPADYGQEIKLTFRAKPGGHVLATATMVTSGCGLVDLTVGGKAQPGRGPGVGRAVAAKSLKIAGISWKLPPALP